MRKYATFQGWASRSEYWWFIAFYWISMILLSVAGSAGETLGMVFGVLILFAILLLFLPSLAVGARRLHDSGRSGWWQLMPLAVMTLGGLINIITIVVALSLNVELAIFLWLFGALIGLAALLGVVVLLVWLVLPGNPQANRYGDPPGAIN